MSDKRYKYPRTPHLPWSLGVTEDDIRILDISCFEGKQVVVTEKMDGENTTLYRDHMHARSIDSRHHPSRDWIKKLHGRIAWQIPVGWRFCGENMYARHSIGYDNLKSYFYLFSIWDENNSCLSWEETLEWAALLELETVPVLYKDIWNAGKIQTLAIDTKTMEGYVVRLTDRFSYREFALSIGKWVRAGHVQTDEHWMFKQVEPNGLEVTQKGIHYEEKK